MSHKTNPISNRLPLNKNWRSQWFADGLLPYQVIEDAHIRELIDNHYHDSGAIERIEIRRNSQELLIMIRTAKPGIVIGRGGKGIQELRQKLERRLQSFRDKNTPVYVQSESDVRQVKSLAMKIEIIEIKNPELYSRLVAQSIASQIERRIAYRRAVRQAIEKTMERGAKGIRISVSGRIGGSDIARTEKFSEGTVPLSTLRNDIDYAHVDAMTSSFGTIGVKVWIYRGDKLAEALKPQGSRTIE